MKEYQVIRELIQMLVDRLNPDVEEDAKLGLILIEAMDKLNETFPE